MRAIDSYCEGGKIVQVGLLPENQDWEEISLRFDFNYVLVQKNIFKTGDSPDDEKTLKTGKKVKSFAFSGTLTKLTKLPEFHLALRKHLAAATTRPSQRAGPDLDAGRSQGLTT